MATSPKQSRVAESVMQLLIQEIVASVNRTTTALAEAEGSGTDTAVLAAHAKLERLGFDIGQRFVERVAQNRLVPAEPLEVIKFLCKDLWQEVTANTITLASPSDPFPATTQSSRCTVLGVWKSRGQAADQPPGRLCAQRLRLQVDGAALGEVRRRRQAGPAQLLEISVRPPPRRPESAWVRRQRLSRRGRKRCSETSHLLPRANICLKRALLGATFLGCACRRCGEALAPLRCKLYIFVAFCLCWLLAVPLASGNPLGDE